MTQGTEAANQEAATDGGTCDAVHGCKPREPYGPFVTPTPEEERDSRG